MTRPVLRRSILLAALSMVASAAVAGAHRLTIATQGQGAASLDADSVTGLPGETRLGLRRISVSWGWPVRVFRGSRVVWINTTGVEGTVLEWRGVGAHPLADIDRLNAVSHRAQWTVPWGDGWSTGFFASLGLAGDGGPLSGRSFQARGGVALSRRIGENYDVGFGLGYLNQFGAPRVYPVLTLGARSEERFDRAPVGSHLVSIRLPVSAVYWYVPADRFRFGAQFHAAGSSHFLTREGPYRRRTLDLSQLQLGPAARVGLGDAVALELLAGQTFRRRITVRSGGTETEKVVLRNGAFARFSLVWTLGRHRPGR